jgi:hypothetical protein
MPAALYLKWLHGEIKWLAFKLAPLIKIYVELEQEGGIMKRHFSGRKFSTLNSDYCDRLIGISLFSVDWKSGILFPTGPEICFVLHDGIHLGFRIHLHCTPGTVTKE